MAEQNFDGPLLPFASCISNNKHRKDRTLNKLSEAQKDITEKKGWMTDSACSVACAKKKIYFHFASIFWWLLEVGIETPKTDFQI